MAAPDQPVATGASDPLEPSLDSTIGRSVVDHALTENARRAALQAGSAPVPRKFIIGVAVGFAILGLGGVLGEHLLGNAGATSSSPTSSTTSSSLDSFIGLVKMKSEPAPNIVGLRSPNGSPWSLSLNRGEVTVLTFLSANCRDICPVEAREIADVDAALGTRAGGVKFDIINADPRLTTVSANPAVLRSHSLEALGNVTFLTGTLRSLNQVWINYGVTISVQKLTNAVAHNDLFYFVNPRGQLVMRATPFANESLLGIYSLSNAETRRYVQGVTSVVRELEIR